MPRSASSKRAGLPKRRYSRPRARKRAGWERTRIVKLETERVWHDPVPVYDPWYDPFYGFYSRRGFRPYLSPWEPYPWGPYRYVGGGYSYVLKAAAIRYTDK